MTGNGDGGNGGGDEDGYDDHIDGGDNDEIGDIANYNNDDDGDGDDRR